MRRMLKFLVLTLALGLLGGAGQASAAEFLWIAGANFSYAASACATSSNAFYAWALFSGANSAAYAYTGCSDAFGSSGSFAIAQAGIGGMGAVFANGFADPYAGLGINTNLTDSTISGESYSTDATSGASSELLTSSTDTGTSEPLVASNVPGGSDELLIYQTPSELTEGQVCTDLGGGSSCGSAQTSSGTSTGDITDLGTLESDLGLTPSELLGSLSDPNDQNYSNPTFGNPSNVLFIGVGEAAPEPGTILLLGTALLGFGVAASRRCSRRG